MVFRPESVYNRPVDKHGFNFTAVGFNPFHFASFNFLNKLVIAYLLRRAAGIKRSQQSKDYQGYDQVECYLS